MRILLLPGADGTGILFKPFLQQLLLFQIQNISVNIIYLNKDDEGHYLDQNLSVQAKRIESNFIKSNQVQSNYQNANTHCFNELETKETEYLDINEPVTIIAESYSGLLAYELAKRNNLNITYIVFVASFLSCPSKLASLAPLCDPIWLKTTLNIVPNVIWGKILFGRWQNAELQNLLINAMRQTPDDLLKQRLKIIANASMPDEVIDIPCLYLQASHDNLVSSDNITDFKRWFSKLDTSVVEGTHFLLQTNAKGVLRKLLSHKVFDV